MAINMNINKLMRLSSIIRGFAIYRKNSPSYLAEEEAPGPRSIEKLEVMYKENILRSEPAYIGETQEFVSICRGLKQDMNKLTEGKLIQALKCLNFFKVKSTTDTFEQLLYKIEEKLDYLSLDQIAFLNVLLRKSDKSPLVRELISKLPIVFYTRVQTKFDIKDFESFINVLEYVRKNPEVYHTVPKIIEKLNKFNFALLTPENARELLFIFLDLPLLRVEPVISKIIDIVANSADILEPSEILAMMSRILKKKNQKDPNSDAFVNENLIDNIITCLVSKDMGYDIAIDVLSNVTRLSHPNHELIDYIVSNYDEDISLLKDEDYHVVQDLVNSLALTNYKPSNWDKIKEHLFREDIFNEPYVLLLQLAIDFSILDCYWPELLKQVFDIGFLDDPRIKKKYLFLYEIIKIKFPKCQDILPNDEVINLYKESISHKECDEYLIKSILETIAGGEQYIVSSIKTNLGFPIDYVMIMKNGEPVAINNADKSFPKAIEELTPIPDSQVKFIMYVPQEGYFEKFQQPSAFWSLLMQILEAQTKHTVIPIYSKAWKKLNDDEQLEYLTKILKPKSDEPLATVNA